ncbi:hypothetical protein [uncultured Gammaproteobacteria bacterium]|uniref:Uncharacterized protein n=1 Tax=Bathymodiolus azoricus thioautotrophic gill symbiont TaxID=235205 RepID=A0A1H6JWW7_9GAMM|nr:hypothetical protein [uncultured Gammaproteobacteria bacterium]SEH67217.1 hypothetical protein BAZSYMA_ACONTIG03627_11 [Bathymodiolus azoricus thioautotrophic gill symbiont]
MPYTGIVIMCIGLDLTGVPSGDSLLILSRDTLLALMNSAALS